MLDPDRAGKIRENLGRDEKRIDWTLRAYQPAFIADRLWKEHPRPSRSCSPSSRPSAAPG